MIYADNAATTKISKKVLEKMQSFLENYYGNPSSLHKIGKQAKQAVEKAREQFALAINSSPEEIIFTSSGTESNNWVLLNVAASFNKGHIITSSIEHHSVLNVCKILEKQGFEITYLPVDAYGSVSCDNLLNALRPDTKLVSIMLANNEIGTIQPIQKIGQFLKTKNILLHTDAVQALGHIFINVEELGVDFLTASAHKFNGPKGCGILYKKKKSNLLPLMYGGMQENNSRAGTENTVSIIGSGWAIEEAIARLDDNYNTMKELSEVTIGKISSEIQDVIINGHPTQKLPHILNLTFEGISGEALMNILDLKDICVSTSSACSSGKSSHVLKAIGRNEEKSIESIRISYGAYNTINDAYKIAETVCFAVKKIKGSIKPTS